MQIGPGTFNGITSPPEELQAAATPHAARSPFSCADEPGFDVRCEVEASVVRRDLADRSLRSRSVELEVPEDDALDLVENKGERYDCGNQHSDLPERDRRHQRSGHGHRAHEDDVHDTH